jgi:hypothetical protein
VAFSALLVAEGGKQFSEVYRHKREEGGMEKIK